MQAQNKAEIPVVLADDDENIAFLVKTVFKKHNLLNPIVFVRDGDELLDCLLKKGRYSSEPCSTPGLIILDLNMPRKDGREVLKEIRSHDHLRGIPIIVFSISKAEKDIYDAYRLGADAYVRKPMGFKEFAEMIQDIIRYWIYTVEPKPVFTEEPFSDSQKYQTKGGD